MCNEIAVPKAILTLEKRQTCCGVSLKDRRKRNTAYFSYKRNNTKEQMSV